MTPRRPRAGSALWQIYAYLYDGLLDVFTYRDMIDLVCTVADCSDRTVLDVGAGTGNVTQGLVKAGAAGVISVDFSSNMLRRAGNKLQAEVARGQVQLILGDAPTAMAGLADESVDRIIAVNILYALKRRREFFQQAHRILTPEGFIVAAHTTRAGSGSIIRDQLRRGGPWACIRPRLVGIAAIDLVIDLLARGGRYEFAPIRVLAEEAAAEGLRKAMSLGRCYGGPDGVNEIIKISAGLD